MTKRKEHAPHKGWGDAEECRYAEEAGLGAEGDLAKLTQLYRKVARTTLRDIGALDICEHCMQSPSIPLEITMTGSVRKYAEVLKKTESFLSFDDLEKLSRNDNDLVWRLNCDAAHIRGFEFGDEVALYGINGGISAFKRNMQHDDLIGYGLLFDIDTRHIRTSFGEVRFNV